MNPILEKNEIILNNEIVPNEELLTSIRNCETNKDYTLITENGYDNFSTLEKFVYFLCYNSIETLNLIQNMIDIKYKIVELNPLTFTCIKDENKYDKDSTREHPLFSSIIFLEDSEDYYFCATNVSHSDYTYKLFSSNFNMSYIKPTSLNMIQIVPSMVHGIVPSNASLDLDSTIKILNVNIWLKDESIIKDLNKNITFSKKISKSFPFEYKKKSEICYSEYFPHPNIIEEFFYRKNNVFEKLINKCKSSNNLSVYDFRLLFDKENPIVGKNVLSDSRLITDILDSNEVSNVVEYFNNNDKKDIDGFQNFSISKILFKIIEISLRICSDTYNGYIKHINPKNRLDIKNVLTTTSINNVILTEDTYFTCLNIIDTTSNKVNTKCFSRYSAIEIDQRPNDIYIVVQIGF